MKFDSRDDAKAWIISNQTGRRNLNTYSRSVLALQLEELIAKKAHERKVEHVQNSSQAKTRDQLAELAKTSHNTIHKVRTIENSDNELLKQQARAGDISINKAYKIATGTENKSPAKAKKDYMEAVQARHEDFTEKSKEGVVSVSDLKTDKEDKKILARDFYTRCLRMGQNIDALVIDIKEGDIDMKEMSDALDKEQKAMIVTNCDKLIRSLIEIKGRID